MARPGVEATREGEIAEVRATGAELEMGGSQSAVEQADMRAHA